jgi:hypothetical protein
MVDILQAEGAYAEAWLGLAFPRLKSRRTFCNELGIFDLPYPMALISS